MPAGGQLHRPGAKGTSGHCLGGSVLPFERGPEADSAKL
jgi:hypothetical protein